MPRKRKSRIYWRNGRAWADLRECNDVGGRRETLKPEGENRATTDADEAAKLLSARLEELEGARRQGLTTTCRRRKLAEYAQHHLIEMARGSEATARHYLSSLSGLYRRAQEDEAVPVGYNPVAALSSKPTAKPKRSKIEWLEVHDDALYLEAARLYDAEGVDGRGRGHRGRAE